MNAEPIAGAAQADRRRRGVCLLLVSVATVAVLTTSRRPPILDLPQQLDQIRLFGEVLAGGRPDLGVNFAGPNRLGYLPLAVAHVVAPTAWVPRVAMALVAVAWLASVHALAAVARRPISSALIASTLLFSNAFYAGFFNFLSGMAALAFWTWELRPERRRRSAGRIFLSSLLGVLLLYLAHGAWLLVGGFAVASFVLLYRFRIAELAGRAAAVALIAPIAWVAGRDLGSRGWQHSGEMGPAPIDRIVDPEITAGLFYGGLRGPLESALLLALVLWLAGAGLGARRNRGEGVEPFLLVAAIVFLLVALLAPYRVDRTIYFAWRWGAPAMVALVLALPAPRIASRLATPLAASLLALQLATTALAWARFGRDEMRGFEDCLRAVPDRASILGLDWQPASAGFRISPTLQMFAYAGAEKGAELGFSFVEFGSSLVVRARADDTNLLGQFLLMSPQFLRPSHLEGYSHVLVHGAEPIAREYERRTTDLRVVAGEGLWHLLEIRRPGMVPAFAAAR